MSPNPATGIAPAPDQGVELRCRELEVGLAGMAGELSRKTEQSEVEKLGLGPTPGTEDSTSRTSGLVPDTETRVEASEAS